MLKTQQKSRLSCTKLQWQEQKGTSCNVSWLIYINQYDFEDYEYTQDGTGVNIIGDSNGVGYYGAEVDSQKEKQKE